MAKRKIVWTKRASTHLFEILEFYKRRNKSVTYSKKLYKRFTQNIKIISNQPEVGLPTNDVTIKGLIIDEFVLYYEATSNEIIIHTIWSSRQNPETLRIR